MSEVLEIFVYSVRDGYVQVSAFVAVTVLIFSLIQYRTKGALIEKLRANRRVQPLVGALMGLTPGCGGAIVMMPLYVRGSISFGTVVATLAATAGDAAFVILALAPRAALYVYGIAFVAAVAFGYAIDHFGLGVASLERALTRRRGVQLAAAGDGPAQTMSYYAVEDESASATVGFGANPAHDYGTEAPVHAHSEGPDKWHPVLTPLSRTLHWVWWVAAAFALGLGIAYLAKGAPEVPLVGGLGFAGLFSIFGILGTVLSFYLYFVGRHYIGEGQVGRVRESFSNLRDTMQHAAMETSFVTVWVLAAYLVYELPVGLLNLDIAAIAASAGVLAPIAGAAVGLIPGCGPQIVLAGAYAQGAVPVSALAANAISQDGDALFPLLAINKKAAVVATIYTVIPALVVGILMHYLWEPLLGFANFGFGAL
jgi:hypothetical protein